MLGGCTESWSNMSVETEVFGVRDTFGSAPDYKSAGREPVDYVREWAHWAHAGMVGWCVAPSRRRRERRPTNTSV